MAVQQYSVASYTELSNGSKIPTLQLGVYMMSDTEAETAVLAALDAGYRGFDSAEWYYNERSVGNAITSWLSSPSNKAKLKREDLSYTTKLMDNISYEAARQSIKDSVRECGLGYIDLYLIHSPIGGKAKRLACWRAVEDAIEAGEVRMGGVSNFGVRHLKELLDSEPKTKPVVNQIEAHPFNTNTAIVEYCQQNGITIQAWAPLVRGMKMTHHTIASLSKRNSCSPAQLLIRWGLQKGFVVLPKSSTPERIRENAEIGDIDIAREDLQVLDGLDEHFVSDWDPTGAP